MCYRSCRSVNPEETVHGTNRRRPFVYGPERAFVILRARVSRTVRIPYPPLMCSAPPHSLVWGTVRYRAEWIRGGEPATDSPILRRCAGPALEAAQHPETPSRGKQIVISTPVPLSVISSRPW